jgi:hypothetical protein
MITPDEIRKQASKWWKPFLQSYILGEPFFPKKIDRIGKIKAADITSNFEIIQLQVHQLYSQSKSRTGSGYTVQTGHQNFRRIGDHQLPEFIVFETLDDYIPFIGKKKDWETFLKNYRLVTETIPSLQEWSLDNCLWLCDSEINWTDVLKVCQYFKQNPAPHLYIRELPINVNTKFIERNQVLIKELLNILISESINKTEKQFERRFNLKYSESQVRFKILDKEISQNLFSGIDDLAIPVSQFETLKPPTKKILIVENKTTLYTTLTLPKMDRAIAIFGQGNAVVNIKNATWLEENEILYWGDIDVQGFEILSRLRDHFPHVKSVLMDKVTFETFFENDFGTPTNISLKLNLTEQEQELYDILKTNNWRLEQEKVAFDYVNKYFLKGL